MLMCELMVMTVLLETDSPEDVDSEDAEDSASPVDGDGVQGIVNLELEQQPPK